MRTSNQAGKIDTADVLSRIAALERKVDAQRFDNEQNGTGFKAMTSNSAACFDRVFFKVLARP